MIYTYTWLEVGRYVTYTSSSAGSDYIAEENQSTSSSSGGAPPRGQSSVVRQNEWMEAKNGHSNKRSYSRQYHAIAGHFIPMELHNSDMEFETSLSRQRTHSPYKIPHGVYEDDPGIMSEAETSATGFRRPSKGRSTLPMVRPPAKVQERALTLGYPETQAAPEYGVVFLQYQKETKRSLLPNELTTLDTIKALFVRSFPKQLTMEYLDSPHVRIYIHDASKDMFYELEDLRDIRDRSVLRIYEQNVNEGDGLSTCDQELNYFSEPEFDSEYQHQHIHRAKQSLRPPTISGPYGRVSPYSPVPILTTDVNQAIPIRCYSPAPSEWRKRTQPIPIAEPRYEPSGAYSTTPDHPYPSLGQSQYIAACERGYESAYDSSPERKPPPISYSTSPRRRIEHQSSFGGYSATWYEDPSYYRSQVYRPRSRSITPVIDEEARKRMEFMEHQLASLTGLVQKVLTTPLSRQQSHAEEVVPTRDNEVFKDSEDKYPVPERELTRHSFREEKSVSFSEDTKDVTDRHSSPEHTSERPTKPAIKARSISKEKDDRPPGGKPKPPPKPTSLLSTPAELRRYEIPKVHDLSPELCSRLRYLRRQTRDLQVEVRSLRRMAQNQAISARDSVRDTCLKIKEMLVITHSSGGPAENDKNRFKHDENLYRHDVSQVEKDLSDLESHVEELRGNVINRRCRVNMSSVENMALLLSRTSKTVADLKVRFPELQDRMKANISSEMEVVKKEEKFLSDEPDRLENALKRCKKLTGTLVTLKRLASVQEQRHTGAQSMPEKSLSADGSHSNGDAHTAKPIDAYSYNVIQVSPEDHQRTKQKENALDELLNELQYFNQTDEIRRDPLGGVHSHLASSYSESYGSFTQQLGHRRSPNPSGEVSSKLLVGEGGIRQRSPFASDRGKTTAPPLHTSRKQQHFQEPPHLPPKKVPPPPPRTTSRSAMQSSNISMDEDFNGAANFTEKIQQVSKRNHSNLRALRSTSDSLRRSTSGDEPQLKTSSKQVIKTRALTEEIIRRDFSSSSSSESANSQEGLLTKSELAVKSHLERSLSEGGKPGAVNVANLRNTLSSSSTLISTRSRQEILEYRHQELLNKQKRLQDQYNTLQQLQRAQLLTRFSSLRRAFSNTETGGLKKTGSESNILSKSKLALASSSGSMTHLSASVKANNKANTELQTPILKKSKIDTLSQSSNIIHETDIM
ncbi:coiled-coil domain-containing protein CG32809-like isoform X3 [Limulus polyphemus]|uniref:Coiled-coil domain-containing protein CG32809-like isoform X3 n=1 Tax=Limulus polyphemus TaxID=6850 RepID=A0ABM1S6Z2_LIMPO|nr:coiled-coil domain-containing protein CG32809-like isoform X3 [Limulus polyphemus]